MPLKDKQNVITQEYSQRIQDLYKRVAALRVYGYTQGKIAEEEGFKSGQILSDILAVTVIRLDLLERFEARVTEIENRMNGGEQ